MKATVHCEQLAVPVPVWSEKSVRFENINSFQDRIRALRRRLAGRGVRKLKSEVRTLLWHETSLQ